MEKLRWGKGELSSFLLLKTKSFFEGPQNLALFTIVFALSSVLIAMRVDPLMHIFDEWYHWGIVDFFINGLWTAPLEKWPLDQPVENSNLGAVALRPDVLFHIIMGPPVMFLSNFLNLETQVLLMRGLNIILHVSWILVALAALRNFGFSKFATGVSLWIYFAIPITTTLASTFNSDNLALLLLAISFYNLSKFATEKSSVSLILATSFAALTLLVKINIGILAVFLLVATLVFEFVREKSRREMFINLLRQAKNLPFLVLWLLLTVAVTGYQYLRTLVIFGSVRQDCATALGHENCLNYPVYATYYELHKAQDIQASIGNFVSYFFTRWIPSYSGSSIWTDQPLGEATSVAQGTATLIYLIFFVGGLVFAIALASRGENKSHLGILTLGATLYLATLVSQNYQTYLGTGTSGAHQFRYVIPLIIPYIAVITREVQNRIENSPFRLFGVLGAWAIFAYGLLAGGISSY